MNVAQTRCQLNLVHYILKIIIVFQTEFTPSKNNNYCQNMIVLVPRTVRYFRVVSDCARPPQDTFPPSIPQVWLGCRATTHTPASYPKSILSLSGTNPRMLSYEVLSCFQNESIFLMAHIIILEKSVILQSRQLGKYIFENTASKCDAIWTHSENRLQTTGGWGS